MRVPGRSERPQSLLSEAGWKVVLWFVTPNSFFIWVGQYAANIWQVTRPSMLCSCGNIEEGCEEEHAVRWSRPPIRANGWSYLASNRGEYSVWVDREGLGRAALILIG